VMVRAESSRRTTNKVNRKAGHQRAGVPVSWRRYLDVFRIDDLRVRDLVTNQALRRHQSDGSGTTHELGMAQSVPAGEDAMGQTGQCTNWKTAKSVSLRKMCADQPAFSSVGTCRNGGKPRL
jgi:hypothetical protein